VSKRKMTNKERDSVITHLLQRVALLEQMIEAEQNVMQMYVKYKGDSEKFNEWITETITKFQEGQDEEKNLSKKSK